MLGVNMEELLVIQGKNAEENLEALRNLTKSPYISFVVLDSVASLVPKVIMEKGVEESTMALLARYMSAVVPQIVGYCATNKSSVLFINQLRASLSMYGAPTTTSGGNSLKYYASTRLETRKGKPIVIAGEAVGITVEVKGIKNKCARPFVSKELTILFPHKDSEGVWRAGVDWISDLINIAVDRDIIIKTGGWHEFGHMKINGIDAFKEALSKDSKLLEELRARVYQLEEQEDDGTEEENQAA